MAFTHGKNTKVLVTTADLSQYCKEAQATTQFDMAETSAFGNTYKTFIQGLGNAQATISGYFDSTAVSGPDVILNAAAIAPGTDPLTIGWQGLAIGSPVTSIGANTVSYEVHGSIGDVVSFTSQFGSATNSGGKTGYSLHDLTPISAVGNYTAFDNGALTSNGGYGLLHVTANTMNAGTTLKIQHSVDNVTFADLITFTVITTSTTTSEMQVVAAGTTVNRYLRSAVTATGVGSLTFHANFVRL